jgi:hypothetical protein
MKPRGKIKEIIIKVNKIQLLIKNARMNNWNDQNQNQITDIQNALEEALELCSEIREMYDPI